MRSAVFTIGSKQYVVDTHENAQGFYEFAINWSIDTDICSCTSNSCQCDNSEQAIYYGCYVLLSMLFGSDA